LGAATYNFTTNLTIGSRGPDVVALQQILIAQGYSIPLLQSGAAAYGYFGVQTRAAVAAYQRAHSITPAVGYFGPITRASLNAGQTPTVLDEQRALLIQQLQRQLITLLSQLVAALQAR
jgi:peptidoglycan hydrolase-like protein with peptidoglycan-binding domain